MNFETMWMYAVEFYHEYSIVVVVIAVIFVVIAYQKPKACFKFVIFLVIMACIIYAIGLFGESIETGTSNKDKMINKTRSLDD